MIAKISGVVKSVFPCKSGASIVGLLQYPDNKGNEEMVKVFSVPGAVAPIKDSLADDLLVNIRVGSDGGLAVMYEGGAFKAPASRK